MPEGAEDEAGVTPPVRLLRDFVNTREPQTGHEELVSPEALSGWLSRHAALAVAPVLDAEDLQLAVTVREGLRAAMLAHAGHDVDVAGVDALDGALASIPVRLSLSGGRPHLRPIPGTAGRAVGAALAPLVEAVRASAQEDSWRRLKACSRSTCHWAYYDASRNQSRRWCSMAGCGNYVKMRRRAAALAEPGS